MFCESHVWNEKSQLSLLHSKEINWRVLSEKEKKKKCPHKQISARHPQTFAI